MRDWTFGRKIAVSFAVTVALTFVVSTLAVLTLRDVARTKDRVLAEGTREVAAGERLLISAERRSRLVREYVLAADADAAAEIRQVRAEFAEVVAGLRGTATTQAERDGLAAVEAANARLVRVVDALFDRREAGESASTVMADFDTTVPDLREALEKAVVGFLDAQKRAVAAASRRSSVEATRASNTVIGISVILAGVVATVALLLSRSLSRQISGSVGKVRSSAAKLQVAAAQQASGVREQATAMTEITTTIAELLATSRQIAQSAQHVAEIAQHTAEAARSGELTVDHAHQSITAIREQVDLVVGHMVELGVKSQQVGAVLDIVAELAEQTNILAINATIEAAGAGESGARFAVVADEIRKLADRVAGSTKQIRELIEEVRSAVNTTIMATESGSKSVDAGARQFADLSASFRQITELVGTTTDAAREIELSTKQQAGGVEQVDIAVGDVAQAMREAEVGSGQTQQTAAQLVTVSRELLRLVHSEGGHNGALADQGAGVRHDTRRHGGNGYGT